MSNWRLYRKEGWKLNDNDKVVTAILKRIETCNGECPCSTNNGDTQEERMCPCKDYRINDICHCNLYVKKNNNE